MKLTKENCQIAIGHLQLAMTQLEPDGWPCAICDDNGHQAFECHYNPLAVIAKCDSQNAKLTEACNQFIAWNKKYPSSQIYGFEQINRIAAELDELCIATENILEEGK